MRSYRRSASSRPKPSREKIPTLINSGYRRTLPSQRQNIDAVCARSCGSFFSSDNKACTRCGARLALPRRSQTVSALSRPKASLRAAHSATKSASFFSFKRTTIAAKLLFRLPERLPRPPFASGYLKAGGNIKKGAIIPPKSATPVWRFSGCLPKGGRRQAA